MKQPDWLEYHIADGVTAFSTTRHGGVSKGNYAEFNVNEYCGDDKTCIEANRMTLCRRLGITTDRLVYPHQVHGTVVKAIGPEWFSWSPNERKEYLEGVDAVMTDLTEVCIGVSTADCIPVLLYDAQHHACCAIHAGWRGTVARIVEEAVRAMVSVYQSEPQCLRAVVGPGISLKNFEVGDEVYHAFDEAGFDMTRIAVRHAKWHIDLWEANRLMLLEMGVPAKQIQVAGVCTYDQAIDFFSARRLGIASGRILTAIMLHP